MVNKKVFKKIMDKYAEAFRMMAGFPRTIDGRIIREKEMIREHEENIRSLEWQKQEREAYNGLCNDCAKQLYPEVGDLGAITVSIRTCPRCKKKKTVVIPIIDLQTGNKGALWD